MVVTAGKGANLKGTMMKPVLNACAKFAWYFATATLFMAFLGLLGASQSEQLIINAVAVVGFYVVAPDLFKAYFSVLPVKLMGFKTAA